MLMKIRKCHLKRILTVYKVLNFFIGYIACRSCTAKFKFTGKTIGPQVQPYKVDMFLSRVLGFSVLLKLE